LEPAKQESNKLTIELKNYHLSSKKNYHLGTGITLSVSIWAIGSSASTLSAGSEDENMSSGDTERGREGGRERGCILFRKLARVPSVTDSPMKGTTASTKSP
jgi:hypothetical protein